MQIAVVFAGVNGFLDDVAIEKIRSWEADYTAFMKDNYAALLADIKSKKQIDDSIKTKLEEAIKAFKGKKG